MDTKIKQTAFIVAFAVFTSIFLTTCKKTEVLTPPTSVSAQQTGSLIIMSWKKVSDATSYRIYRSATGTSYIPISTINKSGYSHEGYMDKNASEGWNYYKVTVFMGNIESEASYVSCNFIPQLNPPGIPTNVTANLRDNKSSVYVRWNLVDGATGYKVFRSASPTGGYYWSANIGKNNYYYDSKPLDGENFYKITAYNSGGESNPSGYAVCKN